MACFWSSGPQASARQHEMLLRKSLFSQMHLTSPPQLPMPLVRKPLAQSCCSDKPGLVMRCCGRRQREELGGTHSARREVRGALGDDDAGQRKREEGGGDLHGCGLWCCGVVVLSVSKLILKTETEDRGCLMELNLTENQERRNQDGVARWCGRPLVVK